jgi:Ras-related C3 botulinum toxin substrate 1
MTNRKIQNWKHLKILIVGDGSIGKTSFLVAYTTNAFSTEYIPTVLDNITTNVMYNQEIIHLQLWDTAGQEDYKELLPLSYPQTDVFILAFSLVDPITLENIEKIWVQEIRQFCPTTPYILVGLKSDLRSKPPLGATPIPQIKGEETMRKIGALDYIECSSPKSINLKEAFEAAIRVGLDPPSQSPQTEHNPSCCTCIVS